MLKQIAIVAIALAVTAFEVEAQGAGGAQRATVKQLTAAADPDMLRRENEQMLLRAAEEDEKRRQLEEERAEAIAAYEKEQAEERRRLARVAQEREAHRLKLVRESRCQFKPVMTDDDIARCRDVYR